MGTNVSQTPVLAQFARSRVRSRYCNNVREAVRSAFVASPGTAPEEAMRDRFRTAEVVEARVRGVIAKVRDQSGNPR